MKFDFGAVLTLPGHDVLRAAHKLRKGKSAPRLRSAGLIFLFCAGQVCWNDPLTAKSFTGSAGLSGSKMVGSKHPFIDSDLAALMQVVTSQTVCVVYSYDQNGNRLTQQNLGYSGTGTWGSSVFGCFNWTAP